MKNYFYCIERNYYKFANCAGFPISPNGSLQDFDKHFIMGSMDEEKPE